MKIGVPKEIKTHEYRVGLVPDSVVKLKALGHEIIVQSSAGVGIGVSDQAYFDAGARIAATADEVFAEAELLVKVKEPQAEEVKKLRTGQVVFTFLHLAANRQLAEALLQSGVVAIAYETVTDDLGRLPLLMPMSAVAGRIAVQSGAHQLEKPQGGRGFAAGRHCQPAAACGRCLCSGGEQAGRIPAPARQDRRVRHRLSDTGRQLHPRLHPCGGPGPSPCGGLGALGGFSIFVALGRYCQSTQLDWTRLSGAGNRNRHISCIAGG